MAFEIADGSAHPPGVTVYPSSANFFLTHRRGDSEFYNSAQRYLLARIGFECRNQAVQLVLGSGAGRVHGPSRRARAA